MHGEVERADGTVVDTYDQLPNAWDHEPGPPPTEDDVRQLLVDAGVDPDLHQLPDGDD